MVAQWNIRFSAGYRKLKKDLTHAGKAWGQADLREPLPYTAIGPEDFLQLVERYEKETGKRIRPEVGDISLTSHW